MIDIQLKRKHRVLGRIKAQPYSPRTGNSHGPNKDNLPALQPCGRAKAGAKVFVPQPHVHRPKVLDVSWNGRKLTKVLIDA